MGKVLIVGAIIIGIALVLAMFTYVTVVMARGGTIRRRDYKRAMRNLQAARLTIYRVEQAADLWSDAESALVFDIKKVTQEYRKQEQERNEEEI